MPRKLSICVVAALLSQVAPAHAEKLCAKMSLTGDLVQNTPVRTRDVCGGSQLELSLSHDFATGNVGIGIAGAPTSRLEIAGQDAIGLTGFQPFLTLKDTSFANRRGRIQSVNGGLVLLSEGYLAGSQPFSFMVINGVTGNVGIGSAQPTSRLEVIAQDAVKAVGFQPFFTLSDSNAGFARGVIQSVAGGLNFLTEAFLNGSQPQSFVVLNGATGNLGLGTATPAAKLDVNGQARVKSLQITGGADLAEPFRISSPARSPGSPMAGEQVEPGMVVVIDPGHPGELALSTRAYDKRAAGVISGANGLPAGMVMGADGRPDASGDHPVALTGRVWTWCDASRDAIEPGDRLTTSDRPGHAMKVTDHLRADGATIGKAMSALPRGERGLVLTLVSLQ
jgi:hypothetical protein